MSPRLRAAFLLVASGAVAWAGAACSTFSGIEVSGLEATPNPDGKTDGAECVKGFDCKSGVCENGTCTSANGGDPNDGQKNGSETDVDCGGSAKGCADGKSCNVGGDCANGICTAGVCAAPSATDGVKNGDETDVDCGGSSTKAPKCATGKGCAAHADCTSDACSYDKKCVEFKGCTGHFGGDTCGAGETGAADAKHESCCTTVAVTDAPGGAFTMDKYLVTAGRMRAFVERYQGDLQGWVASASPKGWNAAWTDKLPKSMDDALFLLGPGNKRGCDVVNQGGRTYWQEAANGNAMEKSDFSKDVLDEKVLNCVPWYMAQAVCAFDGGRLATNAEISHVYENRGRAGGPTQYPWQFNDTAAYNPMTADPRVVHYYSYETPNPPAAMRLAGTAPNQYPLDHAFYIAPPGRRPTGANMHGIMDVAGIVLNWVDDKEKNFTYTMSWEKHQKKLTPTVWNETDGPDGYYAIGARCVKAQ